MHRQSRYIRLANLGRRALASPGMSWLRVTVAEDKKTTVENWTKRLVHVKLTSSRSLKRAVRFIQ